MDSLTELDIRISELEDTAGDLEDRIYALRRRDDDLLDALRRLDGKDLPAERQRLENLRVAGQTELVERISKLHFVNGQLDEIGRQFREVKALQPDGGKPDGLDDKDPPLLKPKKPKPKM